MQMHVESHLKGLKNQNVFGMHNPLIQHMGLGPLKLCNVKEQYCWLAELY